MPPSEPLAERLWRRVEVTGFCWLWTGPTTPDGYGRIGVGRSSERVHRVAYELLIGPIPAGLVLDHLCRVTTCVNPDHLEPVTIRENSLRGIAGLARSQRSVCPRGHAFTVENTRWRERPGKQPYRLCVTCRALDDARRYEERKAHA